jgi:hypothetical protein
VNEADRFEHILDELRSLLMNMQMIGLEVALVGGQVISLEARARGGDGVIDVRTPTGVVVRRGYSMEPDLLFDVEEAGARSDAILDVLRQRGFKRVRTLSWRKELPEAGEMFLDLFVPPDADEVFNPGGFTKLPAGDLALARAAPLKVTLASGELSVLVPDPVGFLAMKLEAKLELRPDETKDSFDMYAYVVMKGVDEVRGALATSNSRDIIAEKLRTLFGDISSPGVRDVVSYTDALDEDDTALLERAVVDLFEQLFQPRSR